MSVDVPMKYSASRTFVTFCRSSHPASFHVGCIVPYTPGWSCASTDFLRSRIIKLCIGALCFAPSDSACCSSVVHKQYACLSSSGISRTSVRLTVCISAALSMNISSPHVASLGTRPGPLLNLWMKSCWVAFGMSWNMLSSSVLTSVS